MLSEIEKSRAEMFLKKLPTQFKIIQNTSKGCVEIYNDEVVKLGEFTWEDNGAKARFEDIFLDFLRDGPAMFKELIKIRDNILSDIFDLEGAIENISSYSSDADDRIKSISEMV